MSKSDKSTFFKKYIKSQIQTLNDQVKTMEKGEAKKRAKVGSDPTSQLEQMTIDDVSTAQYDSWDVNVLQNSTTENASKPVSTEKMQTKGFQDQENVQPNESSSKDSKPWVTDHLSEKAQEDAQFENWIPPSLRRPEDEFYDLSLIKPLRVEDLEEDGSLQIITEIEGTGDLVEISDTIYYKHQTRFDNGQLVDIAEKRRVADRFTVNDKQRLDFLRKAFLRMKKGQVSWLKVGEAQHLGIYHKKKENKSEVLTEKEKAAAPPGSDIYIEINLTNIRRDPKCDNTASFGVKMAFFEKIRPLCKELVADDEISNARLIYSRCIDCFKNMPKKECNLLSEDQQKQRLDVLSILLLNCSHCYLKKKMYEQCIKSAKDAINFLPESPKAYYRIALAQKEMKQFDEAKESFQTAIKLAPGDKYLRDEYEKLISYKKEQETKQWKQMAGFYNTNQMSDLEKKEQEETMLREKIKRQTFTQDQWAQ